MKQFITILALFVAVSAEEVGLGWSKDRTHACNVETRKQIEMEIGASITYLHLAAFFSRDDINLPGFAEFFFKAASEEREHAHKLVDYMLMRGFSVDDVMIDYPEHYKSPIKNETSFTGLDGLKAALEKEIVVTTNIRKVIASCEDKINDYHFADYLTGEFLDEQHKGQRDLAEKIATLERMKLSQGHLSEFMFDKQLLE